MSTCNLLHSAFLQSDSSWLRFTCNLHTQDHQAFLHSLVWLRKHPSSRISSQWQVLRILGRGFHHYRHHHRRHHHYHIIRFWSLKNVLPHLPGMLNCNKSHIQLTLLDQRHLRMSACILQHTPSLLQGHSSWLRSVSNLHTQDHQAFPRSLLWCCKHPSSLLS